MRKRDLIRYVPGLSKYAEALDHHDALLQWQSQQIEQLEGLLHDLLLAHDVPLVETDIPASIEAAETLPVPARALRILVAGTDDLAWFLDAGKLSVESLTDVLARRDKSLDHYRRILDFGCGCGRVTRHLHGLPAEIHGTDSNRSAVEWCRRYLEFADFELNSLEPPLPYPDGTFDLVYAFSVFTHLTESLQTRWMEELRRVLAPTGELILSISGDQCTRGLTPADRARYDQGHLVVLGPDLAGSNYCSAVQPETHVRNVLARGFDVVEFIPEGAKGNPPQDLYLLINRDSS